MTDDEFNLIEDSLAHYAADEREELAAEIRRLRAIVEPLENLVHNGNVWSVQIDVSANGIYYVRTGKPSDQTYFAGDTLPITLKAAVDAIKEVE